MDGSTKNKVCRSCLLLTSSIILLVFLYSYSLLTYYDGGDQFNYKRLYIAYQSTAFWDIVSVGYSHLNASEPFSLFVIWLGANLGIDKIIYESFLNASLAFYIIKFCRAYRITYSTIILILLNGYVFALFFSAVRLKIAILILLFLYTNNFFKKLASLSILAHFSLVFIFFPISLIRFFSFKKGYRINLKFMLFVPVFLGAALFFIDPIVGKVLAHFRVNQNLLDLSKMIILGVMFYITFGTKYALSMVLVFSPLVLIFGSERILFFIFIVYLYFAFEFNKERIWIFKVFLIYGVFKTLFYVYNVINYGDAFFGQT